MKKEIKTRALVLSLAIPLLVGGLSALLSRKGFARFDALYKPVLTPPDWVFPVVWTILYLLLGWACYLVWTSGASPERRERALRVYALQLAANFLWPLLFFAWDLRGPALALLVLMLAGAVFCRTLFVHIEEKAGRLLTPYLIWLCFALYLNLGVVLLN